MTHRHNRRRGRRQRSGDGCNARHNAGLSTSLDQFITSQSNNPAASTTTTSQAPSPEFSLAPLELLRSTSQAPSITAATRLRSNIPAMLLHKRFSGWREADRAQREDQAARLEARQIQLFGGEPGDDVELCYRMLEYFQGLDYIY